MDFETWRAEVVRVWEQRAPSYVRHDVALVKGTLREIHALGVTVDQFDEALEMAFATKSVRQRQAIYRAYVIMCRMVS